MVFTINNTRWRCCSNEGWRFIQNTPFFRFHIFIINFLLLVLGIRSIVRQLDSPTVSWGIYICDVREIFKYHLFYFKFTDQTLNYTLCKAYNVCLHLIFFFSQFYAKVSDYRAVGLSSRRTIDTHPFVLHIL